MGYPVWQTKEGDLGKISAQEFFNLELKAIDPDGNQSIVYQLVAGQLPKGLRINSNGFISGNPEATYTIAGVPFNTNVDVDSFFTVRAKNTIDNLITDRTFKLTVTGNFKPTILTVADPLGTYLDGSEVNLQLEAVDLNDDTLVWKLISGKLPKGLTLSENGVISGIIVPDVYQFSPDVVGWSNSKWNNISWEFETRSSSLVYNFTVSVSDSKAASLRSYRISVIARNDVKADTTSITADSTSLTADLNADRPPILITKTLGDYAVTNSGGYYAFKFEAIDYDVADITYEINTGLGFGWDEDNTFWDVDSWDRADLDLPPGLSLDPKTGWLTGYIPTQQATTKDYIFGITVYSNNNTATRSPIRYFTLTVLGNLDLAVRWNTNSDLGTMFVGAVSNLAVEAQALSGRDLTYSLKNGSKLPQGLQLLNDGTISGRVSFQAMGFDRGTTTFDKELASKFVYDQNTNFDNVFTFTVIANDFANLISAEKTFTVRVLPITYEPYENLYIKCLPSTDRRLGLDSIVHNTDIIDPNDIYRPLDPYYGVAKDLVFLVSYGIKASKLSDYVAAMQDRHFSKKFYFGDFKVAQGKDINGNVLYDVLYVELIEDTKIYEQLNGEIKKKVPAAFTNMNQKKINWRNPRASYLAQNQLTADRTFTVDKNYINTNDTYYAFEPLNVISPNDLTLMQKDISNNLLLTYLNSLPAWMVSVQSNGKILGYTTGAALAYLKPGAGAKALFNLKQYVPYDIKQIPFVADRYVLNNSYTANFDTTSRRFVSHRYTTFDLASKAGVAIEPVAKIDFAVDRPFSSLNGKSLSYVISTGGFDGITYNLNDKYVVFATQENFSEVTWGPLIEDGWYRIPQPDDEFVPTPLNISIVPGYTEKLSTPTLKNQRGGIWQIKIDENDFITLNFVREITPGEYVFVQQGSTHSNSLQLYDLNALNQGFTVPKYTTTFSQVYLPRVETTFDKTKTRFINNVDTYTIPLQGDKYVMFPKIGVFTNGQ